MTIRSQIMKYNMYILMITLLIVFFSAFYIIEVSFAVMRNDGIMADQIIRDIYTQINENGTVYKYAMLTIAAAVVLIIITVFSVNLMLARKLSKPINELTTAAYKVRNDELDFELLGSGINELNELYNAFYDMRMKLKENRKINEMQIYERKVMLANISHDIKTPLTSVKGYIEAIMDGVAVTRDKLDKYLGIIYKKTAVIEEMINNMSDLSMLELSKVKLNFEYGDVGEFIRSIADEYNSENKYVDIKCLFSGKMIIKADFMMLRRVFSNIIGNSIKYRKYDKCSIDINIRERNEGYVISLADNGIGIESTDIENVFDIFYRADPARTPNIKGSGLGLAIAREIVEQHGGKIWLQSEKDKGTSAFIFLRKEDIDEENFDN